MKLKRTVKYNRIAGVWIVIEHPKGYEEYSRVLDGVFQTKREAEDYKELLDKNKKKAKKDTDEKQSIKNCPHGLYEVFWGFAVGVYFLIFSLYMANKTKLRIKNTAIRAKRRVFSPKKTYILLQLKGIYICKIICGCASR